MDPEQIPLRDLHLPPLTSWWPPGPAWWLVLGLVVIGLGLLIRRFLRSRARSAARRYALGQLDKLVVAYRQHDNAVTFGTELSELLRRTTLAYAPRREVAGLTGEAWLAWLDRDMDRPRFRTDVGKALLELPYQNPSSDHSNVDVDALLAAVRQRLRTPIGGQR